MSAPIRLAAVLAATLVWPAHVAGTPGDGTADSDFHLVPAAHDNYVDVFDSINRESGRALPGAGRDAVPAHLQRMRAPICPLGTNSEGAQIPCPGDPVDPLPECGDAATLPPLWERAVPDAVVTPWRLVGPAVCASAADITPGMVLSAFRRVPLAPSPLVVQPDRDWVLVNKPTVVYADGGPQTLTTTVLGTVVTIVATPTSYAWDFGDGATLTTADAGRPWPAGTLTHSYTAIGPHQLSLTTTWSATYTVAGDATVRDVPGTAATTSTSRLEVRERRAYLVGSTCDDDPAAPGC